jgi:hypothetical protein
MAKELAADLGGTSELSTPKLIGTNLVIRCRIRGACPVTFRGRYWLPLHDPDPPIGIA